MAHEPAIAAIRQGELTAAEAWKLLAPLAKSADHQLAIQLFEALRSWTWRALGRRRRDAELPAWIDALNRVEAFLATRSAVIAAKIEVLAEMLHESLAVAKIADPKDLLRRKHVAPILQLLARRKGKWVERASLMDHLGLKPANTTRLMSFLVDIGWVEQAIHGREAEYRMSAEGSEYAQAVIPQISSGNFSGTGKPPMSSGNYRASIIRYSVNKSHLASLEKSKWKDDHHFKKNFNDDILGAIEIESEWGDEDEISSAFVVGTFLSAHSISGHR